MRWKVSQLVAQKAELRLRILPKFMQASATRVSTGDECSIIIEDGLAVPNEPPAKPMASYVPGWKKGE